VYKMRLADDPGKIDDAARFTGMHTLIKTFNPELYCVILWRETTMHDPMFLSNSFIHNILPTSPRTRPMLCLDSHR
jgi:hypothetical protein